MNPLSIFIIEDGKLVGYERSGECNGCGDCCEAKHLIRYKMSFAGDDKEDKEQSDDDYSEFEGWSCLWAQSIWWWLYVYDDDTEGKMCSSFDKEARKCKAWKDPIEFPAICLYWPVHPKNITRFPRCSFKFKRVEETK